MSGVSRVTGDRLGLVSPVARGRVAVRGGLALVQGVVQGHGRGGAGAAGSSPACPVGVLRLLRQAHAGRRDRGGSAARVSIVGRTGQGVVRCAGRGLASRGRLDKAQGGGVVRGACVVPAPRSWCGPPGAGGGARREA